MNILGTIANVGLIAFKFWSLSQSNNYQEYEYEDEDDE